MDLIDPFFRAVGAFYLAGSYFLLRTILMDSVLDKALSALSASAEDGKEKGRRLIVGFFSVLYGAGGMALMLMSSWALPLFAASLAAQVVWLFWGRRFFIPAEEDDEASVRQIRNASILYLAATLGVVWLWRDGRLGPWDDPLAAALTATVLVGLGGWFLYHLSWKPVSPGVFADEGASEPQPAPQRIIIDPARWLWPLVDADIDMRFSHLTALDGDLGHRIEEWDDVFQNAFDPEDQTMAPEFASAEALAAYLAEGEAIAGELAAIFGTDNVGFGQGFAGLRQA